MQQRVKSAVRYFVNNRLSQLEAVFRSTFGLLCPILMSLGIVYISYCFYKYHQNTEIELKRNSWEEKAEITLASIRSHHTFADLITSFGNNLSNEIETKYAENISGPDFDKLLQQHFDAAFLTSKVQIWTFEVKKGKISSLPSAHFAQNKLRVMQRLFEGLLEFSNDENMSMTRINSHEKFIKGVLGEHSAPLALGQHREGRLTHVTFEASPHYLYWRQFKNSNTPFAGMIALFPANIVENKIDTLQFVANNSLKKTRKHLAAAFIPVNELKSNLPTILPSAISQNSEYREKLIRAFAKLPSDMGITRKKSIIENGHIFFKDYVKTDLPYDAVIFSPLPAILEPAETSLISPIFGVLLLWLPVFVYFYHVYNRIGLPLSLAFRLLFFLSGIIPILLVLSLGFSLVEASYAAALLELRQESINKLNSIDERSDNLLTLFGQNISAIIEQPEIRNLLANDHGENAQKAFNIVRKQMQNLELSVDHMFIFYPGKYPKMFLYDQRNRQTVKTGFDLMAPSVYQINQSFSEISYLPEILLYPAQSNFHKILGKFPYNFLENMFFLSYEKESFTQFGNNSKNYYFSTILSDAGKIISYAVFAANSEKLFRSFFARELDLMNVSDKNIFLAAEELNNSDFTIFPSKKIHVLNSRTGQNALNFLQKCRSSLFEKYITDLDHLYLFFPMSKMQRYAGGCIISLADINKERDLKLLLLITAGIILACFMYVIASFATSHLLEPLKKITATFHQISDGHLENGISITRNDELGQLATTVNHMLDGFKKRLKLGKFVSTTLDKSLSQTENLEDLKKAKLISGTVLFSDIRSFTTLSETWAPFQIADMLNTHLEILSEEIQRLGGQVEQFIGDAIVAFFPDNRPDDSRENAIRAAIAMTKAHMQLNIKRAQNGDFTYQMGIGIEHGQLMAGLLMTETRSEFTIIGPAKSEAEKLETISKEGKHSRIIVSKSFLPVLTERSIAGFEPIQHTNAIELILPGEEK